MCEDKVAGDEKKSRENFHFLWKADGKLPARLYVSKRIKPRSSKSVSDFSECPGLRKTWRFRSVLCFYCYTIAKVFPLTCHNKRLGQLYSRGRLSQLLVDLRVLNHWELAIYPDRLIAAVFSFQWEHFSMLFQVGPGTCVALVALMGRIWFVTFGTGVEAVLFIKVSSRYRGSVQSFLFFSPRLSSCITVEVERGGNLKVHFTEFLWSPWGWV